MWDSTVFDRRTDAIVENLRNDTDLNNGIGESVAVYKGPPRVVGDRLAIFVYRDALDDMTYSMGGSRVDVRCTWEVAIVIRDYGKPEEVEKLLGTLSANVYRNLLANRQSDDWTVAQPTGGTAASLRDERNQIYEVETIRYQVRFEEVLP